MPAKPAPLRLRYDEEDGRIEDLAWWPDATDPTPPSLAFLAYTGQSTGEVEDFEDPTNASFFDYPLNVEPERVRAQEFVRVAVRHWHRVHPAMPRFTETEIDAAVMMAGLGDLRQTLKFLTEQRPQCRFVVEPRPWS